jgi:hypothetical protein
MQQDRWIHSQTRVEYGTNGVLGSPRAWIRRALDTVSIEDTTFQPGTITPHEISVAGIWYRPCSVPITGRHRELFRFYCIPEPHKIVKAPNNVPLFSAIGMCATVPADEIMFWLRVYRESGAAFTWWNTPQDRAVRAVNPEASNRRRTDHDQVFRLLDAGLTRTAICEQLDLPMPNLMYIAKKWQQQNV